MKELQEKIEVLTLIKRLSFDLVVRKIGTERLELVHSSEIHSGTFVLSNDQLEEISQQRSRHLVQERAAMSSQ